MTVELEYIDGLSDVGESAAAAAGESGTGTDVSGVVGGVAGGVAVLGGGTPPGASDTSGPSHGGGQSSAIVSIAGSGIRPLGLDNDASPVAGGVVGRPEGAGICNGVPIELLGETIGDGVPGGPLYLSVTIPKATFKIKIICIRENWWIS